MLCEAGRQPISHPGMMRTISGLPVAGTNPKPSAGCHFALGRNAAFTVRTSARNSSEASRRVHSLDRVPELCGCAVHGRQTRWFSQTPMTSASLSLLACSSSRIVTLGRPPSLQRRRHITSISRFAVASLWFLGGGIWVACISRFHRRTLDDEAPEMHNDNPCCKAGRSAVQSAQPDLLHLLRLKLPVSAASSTG